MKRIAALFGVLLAGLVVGCTEEVAEPESVDTPPNAAAEAADEATGEADAPAEAAVEPEPAEPALPPRRFLTVEGNVKLNGKPVEAGAVIGETDTIQTGAKGHATITLGPGSLIELRAKTKLTLGASERKKISARVFVGQLWSFFAKPTEFEVVTDNAVAGVRGTVFFTDASKKKETIFCACSNTVHFLSLDKKKPFDQEVEAGELEHSGFRFKGKGKRIISKSLGSMPSPPSHPDVDAKKWMAQIPE